MLIKCPKCRKKFNYYSSAYRPFCSSRCKTIDLANWADEKYVIASTADKDSASSQAEDEHDEHFYQDDFKLN